MAVGFIRAAASHTSGGSFSVSQASFTWAVGQAGDAPKGILVLVGQGVASADSVTSVTYGGTAVPAVTGGRAQDTAGEPGSFEAFFLGASVPSGAPSGGVVVTRTNNTTTMWAVGILVSAATDTEVYLPGIVLTQENAAVAQQSVDDGSPGTSSMRFAGVYYGGATPAPAGADSTQLVSGGVSSGPGDATAYGWNVVRETTAGQGARNVGCVNVTSDDRAGVHLAVREPPPASPALELSSFGTFAEIGAGDTINHVTVAVTHHEAAGSEPPTWELWDAGSAKIDSTQTGTASTSDHADSHDFTSITYSQLGTLRVRVYGHAATTLATSVDAAAITVNYTAAPVVLPPEVNMATRIAP